MSFSLYGGCSDTNELADFIQSTVHRGTTWLHGGDGLLGVEFCLLLHERRRKRGRKRIRIQGRPRYRSREMTKPKTGTSANPTSNSRVANTTREGRILPLKLSRHSTWDPAPRNRPLRQHPMSGLGNFAPAAWPIRPANLPVAKPPCGSHKTWLILCRPALRFVQCPGPPVIYPHADRFLRRPTQLAPKPSSFMSKSELLASYNC